MTARRQKSSAPPSADPEFAAPAPGPSVTFTAEELDDYTFALADVLCWFAGFRSAKGSDYDGDMPPGWRRLRDLNCRLKAAQERAQS